MESIITASYAVHFDYDALNAHLEQRRYSRIFILVDENTREHCLPHFLTRVPVPGDFKNIAIPAGEPHKNLETCSRVWESLSGLEADRDSLLINLGGGVVTDLGGFVAAAFKRGIPFINVPTTLLAMVDASIGGKTGVDLGALKNQIGIIRQPELVLIDPAFLKSLDERQLRSGFAEMLKHGLIRDKAYWDTLKNMTSFKGIEGMIYRSVVLKNEVVLQDPGEQHLRKVLNFGHTLGHAIESHFLGKGERSLLHGEAIAAGMVLEAYLSAELTGLSPEELREIKSTFTGRYGQFALTAGDIGSICDLLKFDKKNSRGRVRFVLLKKIGEAVIDCEVPDGMLDAAFAYYRD